MVDSSSKQLRSHGRYQDRASRRVSDTCGGMYPSLCVLMRPRPSRAGFAQQLQAAQELAPGVVALREHRRVVAPIIVAEDEQRPLLARLLPDLVRRLRMRLQQRAFVAVFERKGDRSPDPFVATLEAGPFDLRRRLDLRDLHLL